MSAEVGVDEAGSPWYRHFWPWFIVVLLATSVTAGLTTVWIAVKNQDSLVSGDYYEDGLAINRRLDLERRAASLGLSASLSLDPATGVVRVWLSGPATVAPDALHLSLSHATQAARDLRLDLERTAPGVYEARPERVPESGRWYVTLRPTQESESAKDAAQGWRLSKTLRLPSSSPIMLGAPP